MLHDQNFIKVIFLEMYSANARDKAWYISGRYEKEEEVWKLQEAYMCWHVILFPPALSLRTLCLDLWLVV
jgi:hypothetical protein